MRLVMIVLGCLILSGCAFRDVIINPPESSSVASKLSGGDGREIVVHTPFADDRQIRERCGMVKNTFNSDTASVTCSSIPTDWLANLLAGELRAAGFKVKTEGVPSKVNGLTIDGVLITFFIEPVIGFWSITFETDIHIKLVATSNNGLNAERSFFVKGTYSALTGLSENFQPSVDDATRKIIKDMAAAILTLMNRYPQLGMNSGHGNEIHIAVLERG